MPDLDRYLYDELRARSAQVELPAGDVDAVVARGRGRRRRRRTSGGLIAVMTAGAVVGVVVADSGQSHHTDVSTRIPALAPPVSSPRLLWRAASVHDGLTPITSLASPGEIAYAVSTAPGQIVTSGYGTQTLYRSATGLSWKQADGPNGVSVGDVSVNGARLYSVGTGPATADTGGASAEYAAVSWTVNGGVSWQKSVLPVHLGAPSNSTTDTGVIIRVAAGPKGVVALVQAASIGGKTLAFYSSDGIHYRQVNLPAVTPGGLAVAAGPSGFAAVVGTSVLESGNGSNWRMAPALSADTQAITGAGYVDGRLVLVGQAGASGAGTAYVATSGGWTVTPLPVAPYQVSFGPLGVAAVGLTPGTSAETWEVIFSRDGQHWSNNSLPALSHVQLQDAGVVVGQNQVDVTLTKASSAPNTGPAPQIGLIGTPAGP
jgi:hypothetical protein